MVLDVVAVVGVYYYFNIFCYAMCKKEPWKPSTFLTQQQNIKT